ncbi:MerR family transcriptional regulator [Listeria costaricensis]|uniref:MerR family transcriptional regulator n=1 Tax=Listeria costaricensis TaxID=2026604 RepID=UPI000C074394|nr:MerR family transcriptional regulator [Listeria costaricensis]
MNITQVAKEYELTPDTLRYYERIGLIPPVNRSASGNRDYTEEDLKWVFFAKCMRGAGLPVDMLIEYVHLFQQGDDTLEERRELLKEQRDKLRERLVEMQATLEKLESKVENYDQRLLNRERELYGKQATVVE